MQRIFLPPDQFDIKSGTATVSGADHQHLARVMRAQPGDAIVLLDNQGSAYHARVSLVAKTETTVSLGACALDELASEPSTKIVVAQALGKGDKFEQVLQHGTEVGATAFVPLRTERGVADIPHDKDRAADKMSRWRSIVKGAAEQSARLCIPAVLPPARALDLFRDTEPGVMRMLLHTGRDTLSMREVLQDRSAQPEQVVISVGPEGGWSPAETSAAKGAGWIIVGLGPRILRTETAALVAISQIIYCFEM